MLLISFVCSITSIPFKTGCSVCSSWSFCLYCWLLSSILGCLFVFLNEGLLINICGYDKFLCHCSNLFPQQTLPLNGEAEQEVPIEHVCGEQRAGRQVGALTIVKERKALLHRRNTVVYFIPGKSLSLSLCTSIRDVQS